MGPRVDADGGQIQPEIAVLYASTIARLAGPKPLHQPKARPMIANQNTKHPACEGPAMTEPKDAAARRAIKPVICYPVETLPTPDMSLYENARKTLIKVDEAVAAPREAATFNVPAGHFFRIRSIEGSQVGDLNLWNANDLSEEFYTGKTRALHGTHITTGQQMWSSFPQLRPMATITHDTLDWYGIDEFGGSVHDAVSYTHLTLPTICSV